MSACLPVSVEHSLHRIYLRGHEENLSPERLASFPAYDMVADYGLGSHETHPRAARANRVALQPVRLPEVHIGSNSARAARDPEDFMNPPVNHDGRSSRAHVEAAHTQPSFHLKSNHCNSDNGAPAQPSQQQAPLSARRRNPGRA